MSTTTTSPRPRPVKVWVATTMTAVVAVATVTRHLAVVLVVTGASIIWLAGLFGSSLTGRAVDERDPGRMLVWDALLVGVVVLGLIGVVLVTTPWS